MKPSTAHGPGHPIRTVAGGDARGDFQSFQIENHDGFISGEGNVGSRAIGRDENAFGLAPELKAPDFFARGRVNHQQTIAAEIGDENELAVGSEFEAVRTIGAEVEGLHYFFCGHINDGDRAVTGVGRPEFAAIWRNVGAVRDRQLNAEVRDIAQCVVEAVGEIGGADHQRQFHDLPFVVELVQFFERPGANGSGAARDALGVKDGGFLLFIKKWAALVELQRLDLLVSQSDSLRRSDMRARSIFATVQQGGF